jgi:hypothetical protein
MFNGVLAYKITQRIGIPTVSPKQLLLPPRTFALALPTLTGGSDTGGARAPPLRC